MIKSFRHKGLKALYERDDPSGVKPDQVKRLRALLARLEASSCPDDMDLPGLRLHPLSGKKRAGFFAVNVSGNWRLLFRFDETGNAIDVDWVDCHEELNPMPMLDPPHPGEVIRELCLEPLGLTVTAAAKALGVTRKSLSELLNGHGGISPEMAFRLSLAFGGSPESWLQQQSLYSLAQVRKRAVAFGIQRIASA